METSKLKKKKDLIAIISVASTSVVITVLIIVFAVIYYKCTPKVPKRVKANSIALENFQFRSGDLILFANGDGFYSGLTRFVTKSTWTHVGLVFQDPETDYFYLWEMHVARGTRLMPLHAKISGYRGVVAVRPLLKKGEETDLPRTLLSHPNLITNKLEKMDFIRKEKEQFLGKKIDMSSRQTYSIFDPLCSSKNENFSSLNNKKYVVRSSLPGIYYKRSVKDIVDRKKYQEFINSVWKSPYTWAAFLSVYNSLFFADLLPLPSSIIGGETNQKRENKEKETNVSRTLEKGKKKEEEKEKVNQKYFNCCELAAFTLKHLDVFKVKDIDELGHFAPADFSLTEERNPTSYLTTSSLLPSTRNSAILDALTSSSFEWGNEYLLV